MVANDMGERKRHDLDHLVTLAKQSCSSVRWSGDMYGVTRFELFVQITELAYHTKIFIASRTFVS